MAACDIRFNEHATNVLLDLKQAKELALKMVDSYAMGKGVVALQNEDYAILNRLYEETKMQLIEIEVALVGIESVLMEKESITKQQIGELF
jgi:ATP-dependent Zn protease